ncbi:transposase [Pseudomonas sp. SBB6]|uniref:transposase n=1 Tax=Pseudomonas sp. SBB6 TaxID=2962032 RepID=UPI00265F7A0C|nr:transposase [Pseudomonas sp. SBB6]
MSLNRLRADQWERIKDLLPGKVSDRGATARDNRLFVEAVLWVARTGALWGVLVSTPQDCHHQAWIYAHLWARMMPSACACTDFHNVWHPPSAYKRGVLNTVDQAPWISGNEHQSRNEAIMPIRGF